MPPHPGNGAQPSAIPRDLVGGGIRTRLRPPRNALARMVAGQVALYLAVVGAACGVLLSGYPVPPAEGQALAAALIAVPERPRDLPGPLVACDMICPDSADGDDVTAYRRAWDHTDSVHITYRPPREQVSTVVTQDRRRLAAAGWNARCPAGPRDAVLAGNPVDRVVGPGRVRLVRAAGAWARASSRAPRPGFRSSVG